MKTKLLLVFLFFFTALLKAQTPELKMDIGHSSYIKAMAYSPNGEYLVSGDGDNVIKLWDVKTGKELHTFTGHHSYISGVKFLPDGNYFLSASWDSTMILWDIRTFKEVRKFIDKYKIYSMTLSKDGKYVYTTSQSGFSSKVQSWDISNGTKLKKYIFNNSFINTVAVSPNNEHIVAGFKPIKDRSIDYSIDTVIRYLNDTNIVMWNTTTGLQEMALTVKSWEIKALEFTSDNQYLIIPEANKILFYNTQSKKYVKSIGNFSDLIIAMQNSNDGKYLLALFENNYSDRTLKLFNIKSGEEIWSKITSSSLINEISISSDGKFFVYNDYKKIIECELLTGIEIRTYASDLGEIYENFISLSSDKKKALTKLEHKSLFLFELASGKGSKISTSFSESVSKACFSFDNKYILAGSDDNTLKLFDLYNGGELRTFRGHSYVVNSVDLSRDGKLALSGSDDSSIKLWDITTGENIRTLIGHNGLVKNVMFTPNGNNIISESVDNTLRFWEVKTGAQMFTISLLSQGFNRPIAVSENSNFIFYGDRPNVSAGTNLYIWDFEANKIEAISHLHDDEITSIDISGDSKYLLTGSNDLSIKLLDLSSKQVLKVFKGHFGRDLNAYFFDNDTKIISTASDGAYKYWDIKSGQLLVTFYLIKGSSDWVAINPDGYFDGTPKGMQFLYFTKGLEIIPLEAFFEKFYTPNLISRVLGGEKLTSAGFNFKNMASIPDIKILTPENNATVTSSELTLNIQATDKGGGVDEIRLYHNGKLLDGTTRGFKLAGQTQSFTITLTDGENRIKATAFNTQRTEAIPYEIVVHYKAPQQLKPNLYILAIGINSYLNPKYNLNYAKNDAEAFVQSLQQGAAPLFGTIGVSFISDADATKAGIEAAFEKIKATARAEDVFVFYYAGHGVMSTGSETEKSMFYIVPRDVTKMYEADDMLKKSGLSANEIGEYSKTIKAQKQLFVIDACQSGGVMQTLASRGAAEEKAIAQLARSTGTYFIAASGTEQFATEVAELGHGVFTYAIIEALKGSCKSVDGKVSVNMLKSCIEDRVPELSQKYKGQPQFPTGYGFGMDFPLVLVKQ